MKSIKCVDCIGRFLCHTGIKNGSEQCLTFHNALESKLQSAALTNAQGTKLPEDIKEKLTKFVGEQTSLPVEFAAVLNDNFWDLL